MEFKDWTRFHGTFVADPTKKVRSVAIQVEVKDTVASTTGIDRNAVYFTDIQFQAGETLTGWIPHTMEMLRKLTWNEDEWQYAASPYEFLGSTPTTIPNRDRRWFNIVGRGHKTFILPNYFPEDWNVEVLPTGMEIEIKAKDDFDLLRISSAIGVELPEEERWYFKSDIYNEAKELYEEAISEDFYGEAERQDLAVSNWENIVSVLFSNHPLHKRYTREMWVEGGSAGETIIINAKTHKASKGGVELPLVGVKKIVINGSDFPIERRKFMSAPRGTATLRIEFYKQRERTITTYQQNSEGEYEKVHRTFRYLEDAGIGYHGTVGFAQWTYGKAKI